MRFLISLVQDKRPVTERAKLQQNKMKMDIERIRGYFSHRREVSALFLFGSFDTPQEREESDIDIAVLLVPEEIPGRAEALRTEYYAASPAFSLRSTDIVILNTAPTFLKYHVLKTGRLLLDRDPDSRKEFTARAIQEYFDYKPLEEIYFKGMKARLRKTVHG